MPSLTICPLKRIYRPYLLNYCRLDLMWIFLLASVTFSISVKYNFSAKMASLKRKIKPSCSTFWNRWPTRPLSTFRTSSTVTMWTLVVPFFLNQSLAYCYGKVTCFTSLVTEPAGRTSDPAGKLHEDYIQSYPRSDPPGRHGAARSDAKQPGVLTHPSNTHRVRYLLHHQQFYLVQFNCKVGQRGRGCADSQGKRFYKFSFNSTTVCC